MAKTITIDDEAYKILKSHKAKDESFSDVVKRRVVMALSGKELDNYMAKLLGPKQKKRR